MFIGIQKKSFTKCPSGKVFCLSEGKCVSDGLCNQKRSLWNDKNGNGMKSSADGFNRHYYCPFLNAYVTNKKSCEIMTKLSGDSHTENVGEFKLSCGRGKVGWKWS